jgi:hypothetical protein
VFCPHCGHIITEGQVFCQQCGSRIVADGATSATDNTRIKTPWEDRAANGYFSGLFRTVKEVLVSPSFFFKKMAVTGGLTDPLLFAMIIGTIGLIFFSIWDVILHNTMQSFMSYEMTSASGRAMPNGFSSPLGMVMIPFLLIIWLFIVSGMLHLFLLLVHGARAGFEATFRVISYSVSPFLFLVIPYCGMFITTVWILTTIVIGLRDAHETTGGKATLAVFFPFLLCCGAMLLMTVLFMGAIASSFNALMHLYK